MLISVGERISCALCAMAIHDLGGDAISLTGSQAGIVTDTVHGKAKIVDVRARRIHDALDAKRIVLVAGFQGVSTDFEVTTLGRGGSDMTAVALAAALGADACEIYTDVEGVFTADPRVVPSARKLGAVTYEEMLELAAAGAKVLQLRSVEFARNHNVKLHVRSTFTGAAGTWIVDEEDPVLEKAIISGVAHTRLRAALPRARDRPGAAVRGARRRAGQRRHDPPDRGRRDRLLGARRGPRRRRGRAADARRRVVDARRPRQGHARRRRHEEPSRDRGAHVRDARGRRDQRRRSSRPRRSRSAATSAPRTCRARCRRCTTRSSSRPPMREPRIGVVGATGAVGSVTMRLLAERGYRDVRAFASARSAGTQLETGQRRRGGDARGAPGGRHRRRALLGRLEGLARARPARGARRRGRGRQVRGVPARPTGSRWSCRR